MEAVTLNSIKSKKIISNVSLGVVGERELTLQTYINPFSTEDDIMVMNVFIVHQVGRVEDTCVINTTNLVLALKYLNSNDLY